VTGATTSQTIALEIAASGDVSDYTAAVTNEIAASAAARLGVPASDVTVIVLSGSVIIRIEIATTSAASSAIMNTVQASYSSTTGAQSLLAGVTSMAITVTSAPTTTPPTPGAQQVPSDNSSLVSSPNGVAQTADAADDSTLVTAVIVLSILLAATTCVILVICYLRGRCFGTAAKVSRMPSVRRAGPRPKMHKGAIKVSRTGTKAPEGFGFPLEDLDSAVTLRLEMDDDDDKTERL